MQAEEFVEKFGSLDEKLDQLTTLVTQTIEQNRELQAEMEKQNEALVSVTRKTILDQCNECSSRGSISMYEKQTLTGLYDGYCALGGNSFVHNIYDEANRLPIIG